MLYYLPTSINDHPSTLFSSVFVVLLFNGGGNWFIGISFTIGLGGLTVHLYTSSQLIPLNHGCCLISSESEGPAPNLLLGFWFNN